MTTRTLLATLTCTCGETWTTPAPETDSKCPRCRLPWWRRWARRRRRV